jgi:dTDP-glucose 4,6-dehydratase
MSSQTKVLVTGASGFIGSHLVELLVNQGYKVRALTRYTSDDHRGNLNWLPTEVMANVELYRADLRDAEAISDAMRDIDTVFHLGAIISIPYSYQHPEETLGVNVNGTFNVLQAMRLHGTRRGVIVSTSEVYGSARYVPIDEAHPLQAQSPYSATKISAESLATSFHRSFNTPIMVVRPFNTYGPRQSARAIIPAIISQALAKPVVTLGALHPTRDLTYAADTARGLMLAGCATDEALGSVVNLGTGSSISIGDLAKKIITLIGREIEVQGNDDERMRPNASEVLRLESNNQLAAKLIGWRPEISLDDGLRRTIDWIAAHPEVFDPNRYAI